MVCALALYVFQVCRQLLAVSAPPLLFELPFIGELGAARIARIAMSEGSSTPGGGGEPVLGGWFLKVLLVILSVLFKM